MPERSLETPRELAVRLLGAHKNDIGRGVYKLAAKLHPAWGAVDASAFEHNTAALLTGVQEFLLHGDDDVVLRLARSMMRVRKLAGFSSVDFNVILHVYLPVIRKVMFARAPSLRQGVAAYDAIESVLLPLVARLVEASAKVDASITTPDATPPFHGRPFEEVPVDGELPEFMLPEYEAPVLDSVDDVDVDDERTDPAIPRR